jgi:archaellum biogenesis ATPase FlaH
MMLERALHYASHSWPVFPCQPRGKRPLVQHGLKQATTDDATIKRWWTEWPNANIGVALTNIVVVDVDGEKGEASLRALTSQHGELPLTLESKTARGRHFFFTVSADDGIRNNAGKLGPGIDVRAQGGYVVVPPSQHETGAIYTWTRKQRPTVLPDWLRALLTTPSLPAGPPATVDGDVVIEGQRNATLTSRAGTMRRAGLTREAIEAALLAENNQRCRPPLPETEVRQIAESISRYQPAAGQANGQATILRAITRCFSNIEPQPVRWLWQGRIPLGKLSMWSGDPDLGKSVVSVDVAARVSRGDSWPDGSAGTQGAVLFVSAEDDAADTIRPRLDVAAADVACIHTLDGVRVTMADGKTSERGFTLLDVDALDEAIRRIENVRLLVIDPLSAYLADTDSHVNAAVRGLLTPLAKLAEVHQVAMILVNHLNKAGGQSLYRSMGSVGFVAAVRVAWLFARDREDPERRLILPQKNNLTADRSGWSYVFRSVVHPDPRVGELPGIEWKETVNVNPDDAIAPAVLSNRIERAEALDWVREALSGGPMDATIIRGLAGEAGLSWHTVRRAADDLGVVHKRSGFGPHSHFSWEFPDH